MPRESGGMLPWEILKMHTLGDAFSLIWGAKSRAFRTDFYQVTSNKVVMNWGVDWFYCLLIFSLLKPTMIIKEYANSFKTQHLFQVFP